MHCAVDGSLTESSAIRGKQVRDNIHSHDLVRRSTSPQNPKGGEV